MCALSSTIDVGMCMFCVVLLNSYVLYSSIKIKKKKEKLNKSDCCVEVYVLGFEVACAAVTSLRPWLRSAY